MYICEFEFTEADGWVRCRPFWPGCDADTQGGSFEDAVEMSADWLRAMVLDSLARLGRAPRISLGHEPLHGGRIVTIAVDADPDDVPSISEKEAAARLGVTHARVSQLCRDGILESWTVGRTRLVSEASVEQRLAERSAPGRSGRDLDEVPA